MSDETHLHNIRKKIDALDEHIQLLINQRAQLAVDVGQIKKASTGTVVFHRPAREAEILQKVKERNNGPLSTELMLLIFSSILTACLGVQQPIKVATLGPKGTFSNQAVNHYFGKDTDISFTDSFKDIFHKVETRAVDYGVVPITNSTSGSIKEVSDLLSTSPLRISAEVILPVHHLLLTSHKSNAIHTIVGHEQALKQCEQWLSTHYPNAELVAVSSNAEGAKRAKENNETAAIAGELTIEEYGLEVVARNIQDNPDNKTRFLILTRPPASE
jgi:chorismate mutase / prephenate dehydratase